MWSVFYLRHCSFLSDVDRFPEGGDGRDIRLASVSDVLVHGLGATCTSVGVSDGEISDSDPFSQGFPRQVPKTEAHFRTTKPGRKEWGPQRASDGQFREEDVRVYRLAV